MNLDYAFPQISRHGKARRVVHKVVEYHEVLMSMLSITLYEGQYAIQLGKPLYLVFSITSIFVFLSSLGSGV